jgi:EAL domain-containing protein (putative c-di-GMP-specific phosphodiesterase class I)
MKTVAEGVETQEIMDTLKELGCDYQQGYYISRPLDASALTEWLKERDKMQQTLF